MSAASPRTGHRHSTSSDASYDKATTFSLFNPSTTFTLSSFCETPRTPLFLLRTMASPNDFLSDVYTPALYYDDSSVANDGTGPSTPHDDAPLYALNFDDIIAYPPITDNEAQDFWTAQGSECLTSDVPDLDYSASPTSASDLSFLSSPEYSSFAQGLDNFDSNDLYIPQSPAPGDSSLASWNPYSSKFSPLVKNDDTDAFLWGDDAPPNQDAPADAPWGPPVYISNQGDSSSRSVPATAPCYSYSDAAESLAYDSVASSAVSQAPPSPVPQDSHESFGPYNDTLSVTHGGHHTVCGTTSLLASQDIPGAPDHYSDVLPATCYALTAAQVQLLSMSQDGSALFDLYNDARSAPYDDSVSLSTYQAQSLPELLASPASTEMHHPTLPYPDGPSALYQPPALPAGAPQHPLTSVGTYCDSLPLMPQTASPRTISRPVEQSTHQDGVSDSAPRISSSRYAPYQKTTRPARYRAHLASTQPIAALHPDSAHSAAVSSGLNSATPLEAVEVADSRPHNQSVAQPAAQTPATPAPGPSYPREDYFEEFVPMGQHVPTASSSREVSATPGASSSRSSKASSSRTSKKTSSRVVRPIISFHSLATSSEYNFYSGVPMQDCLKGTGIRDPSTPVFEKEALNGSRTVKLIVRWPSYEDTEVNIDIYGRQGVMTRAELAQRVASEYANFVAKHSSSRSDTGSSSVRDRWRIGHQGYELDRMMLRSIWSPVDNVWQASVRVLTHRDLFWALHPSYRKQ
ncbi:hypothetical protein AcW1_010088 [Taiwanofungus camphoratus]|nr:hypothetical protein AcW1_010088 [Antrodia cinnamomea]